MFNTIRTASAAAFLVVALSAAIASPPSRPSSDLGAVSRSAVQVAAARAKIAAHLPTLSVFTVTVNVPPTQNGATAATNSMRAPSAAFATEVRRTLPRLRLDVPYYSFGGSAGTRASE